MGSWRRQRRCGKPGMSAAARMIGTAHFHWPADTGTWKRPSGCGGWVLTTMYGARTLSEWRASTATSPRHNGCGRWATSTEGSTAMRTRRPVKTRNSKRHSGCGPCVGGCITFAICFAHPLAAGSITSDSSGGGGDVGSAWRPSLYVHTETFLSDTTLPAERATTRRSKASIRPTSNETSKQ